MMIAQRYKTGHFLAWVDREVDLTKYTGTHYTGERVGITVMAVARLFRPDGTEVIPTLEDGATHQFHPTHNKRQRFGMI